MEVILIIIVVLLVLFILFYALYNNRARSGNMGKIEPEIEKEKLDTLIKYVNAQKEENEQKQQLKNLKTAEMKEKLENFKRTKDQLKDQLRDQLNAKDWTPLEGILKKLDKGNIGIYVLYNETKNKYYVGQSKEIYTRIKKHFEIEPIALDFISGDIIKVKILNASELDADYRIDHIEKTGIEIFDANKSGYNKTTGNL